MKFTKMHGAGNDYVYIDARVEDRDWPTLSVAMSDRHTGVGSDGIILAWESDKADIKMRMFNADGSEGEMCGNGIRCLVRFAMERGIVPVGVSPVSVDTLAGVKQVTPLWEGGKMARAKVGMGEPLLRAEDIPVIAPGHEVVVDGRTFRSAAFRWAIRTPSPSWTSPSPRSPFTSSGRWSSTTPCSRGA